MSISYKLARRVAVVVVGGTLLLLGVLLLVLPGPGIAVAAVGLAVLSVEFAWARHWLKKIRRGISGVTRAQRLNRTQP